MKARIRTKNLFHRSVQHLKDAGFTSTELGAYVLHGLPGQAQESVMDTLEMVYDTGIRSYLTLFSPVPGTPYFKKAASIEPQILTDPLLHNKHYFSFMHAESFRQCQEQANRFNHTLDHSLKITLQSASG